MARNSPPLGFLFVMAAVCMVGYMFTDISRRQRKEQEGAAAPQQQVPALEGRELETASLTALTVRQTEGLGTLTADRGAPSVLIASFEFETNPDSATSVELEQLNLEFLDKNLVLRNLDLEVDDVHHFAAYLTGQSENGPKVWFYRRPIDKKRFGAGKKFRANLYATPDKSSQEGTYTRPLRITDWRASDQGKGIPFPGTVNGQPVVVR